MSVTFSDKDKFSREKFVKLRILSKTYYSCFNSLLFYSF